MQKKIHDYGLNDSVDIFVMIKAVEEKTTKTGKPYLALIFQDTSGEISANYWDATSEDVHEYQEGKVVYLEGKREEYMGSPQFRIYQMRCAAEGEPSNPELYIERAPLKKKEMIDYLANSILEITNPTMNRLVRELMNKFQHDFFQFPAAKSNHHAFHGGLAYHTVTMLKIAKALVEIYPDVNKSLLFSGLILHDLGKVMELTGPKATQYTLEGNLMGHIVIVSEELTKACQTLGIDDHSEEVLLLKHMVLSHHGLLEYGSPVRPQLKEAELLHQIDMIDASMNMVGAALDKVEPGQFSSKIWALNNRSFYKPHEG